MTTRRDRLVLDTNVLVSAVLFGGPPRRVVEMAVMGVVECSLSIPILDELRDVLMRPKFGFTSAQALRVVEELQAVCDVVVPSVEVDVVDADPDDNRVIECALEAAADFIVSGDSHLLDLHEFQGIRIFSARQYLEHLRDARRP